jgi:hypothetical protein
MLITVGKIQEERIYAFLSFMWSQQRLEVRRWAKKNERTDCLCQSIF